MSTTLALTASLGALPFGAMSYLCGLFQAVKLISLATGNVEGVLVGAIGGGLACGFGW